MNAIGILLLFACCALHCCGPANGAPVKRIDQRQDGDLNIQAHLDKIVLLIVPNKNVNILDIKGQGGSSSSSSSFDNNYEDLLPLLGKENVLHELKYKLSQDEVKLKTLIGSEAKDGEQHRKDGGSSSPAVKVESKIEPKEAKDAAAKKTDAVRETTPKKIENESKITSEATQKKMAAKSDGRTYQTVQSGNNRERVIAVSGQEMEQKKAAAAVVPFDAPPTKIEKL